MSTIVIAGGHGQIALLLTQQLTDAGHTVRGLIRNPDHTADLEARGAEAVVCDIEAEEVLDEYVRGADAVVFAAGAGPGSGPERKQTVDLGAALKLIGACQATGVDRYLMVSAISADRPEEATGDMLPYMRAKAGADNALQDSPLAYTIVRPGALTNDAGTGKVAAGPDVERGEIPREDVAAVLAACLADDTTIGKTFNLVAGPTPIDKALAAL